MSLDAMLITPERVDTFLINAANEVFEKMFFTEAETSGTGGCIETIRPIRVAVTFSGPLTGTLCVLVDEDTARSLGLTLTCLDAEEFSRERCVQAAGELANMICGCLLSHVEPEANLALASPVEVDSGQTLGGSIRRWFCLPEGPLLVEFELDQ